MIYITEGAVAAIVLAFLIAAAIDNAAASFIVHIGL